MQSNKQLRVMQIVPSFHIGGAEQMVAHLAIHLAEAHQVTAVGLYPSSSSSIEQRLANSAVQVRHLEKHSGFDPKILFSLGRLLHESKPHIVHTHLSVLRYVLPALTHYRVPAIVHTLHSIAERENDAFGRALQWLAFRRRVTPVAISTEVAASFRRTYGIDCANLVPNCIPVEDYDCDPNAGLEWRLRQGIDPGATVFTTVGRLEPVKNHLLLLQAFAAIPDANLHLAVIGDGKLKKQLISIASDLKISTRVSILGNRNDVPTALAASDVFVLSSNWEGSPLSVLEAMASGIPVISTAVGGVPELVRSGTHGLLVPPGDKSALTGAMCKLAYDARARARFGQAARSYARTHYSLQRMVAGYTSVYESALKPVQVSHVSIATTSPK